MGFFPNDVILNFRRLKMAIKLENLKRHLNIDCCTNVRSDSKNKGGVKVGWGEEKKKGMGLQTDKDIEHSL